MTARPPLPLRLVVLYALPALALAVPTIPVAVYLPTFYAETVGLGLTLTGVILFASRAFDVITDPLVGVLSDRTKSRFGRRKPWALAGGCLVAPALIALFNPPDGATWVYLLGVSLLVYLGWTMIAVPYFAWAAELSTDYSERAKLTSWREGLTLVGIVIAGSVPAIIAGSGGTESEGLLAVALVAVALGLPTFFLLAWYVPDRANLSRSKPKQSIAQTRFSFKNTIHALRANGPFRRLISAWFVNGFANGLPAALFPLYLTHALGASETEKGILIFSYFAAGIAALPFWMFLSRHIGKHRAWCVAMMIAVAAFAWVPFIEHGAIIAFAIVCVVSGSALGADLALPPAMQADVIDYDKWRFDQDRAGTFFAMWSMATKFALALGVGLAFPALDAFGFSSQGDNTATALLALTVIYAGIPCVLKTIAIAMVWNHPISARRLRAIQSRIARKSIKGDGYEAVN